MTTHYYTDTIVAISTPIGKGGIGILRTSGKLVPMISTKLLGTVPEPRKAEYLPFSDENGSILERVIALFFIEPYSFTGENVLEIHSHGGIMILDLLLNHILKVHSNIRLANPGEFTERAFLNNKIDLIQAEAVADIIEATSYQAAKSASNSLQGKFSKQIHLILEKITNLRVYVESSIDFSDEEIDNIPLKKIELLLKEIINDINHIYKSAHYGFLLKEGIKFVIAGKPNAGKSSLFNTLINTDRAIVSSIPGTTRDTLCEYTQFNGIPCYITDTAGLRENSINEIESMGIQRTWNELKKADHILWVIDSHDDNNKNCDSLLFSIKKIFSILKKEIPITIIRNKSDLSLETVGINTIKKYTCITISVLLNQGIDLLQKYLFNQIKAQIQGNKNHSIMSGTEDQSNFIARKRHLNSLKKVSYHLLSAQQQHDNNNMIFLAEELKSAHNALNEILGKSQPGDLLKRIFSTFCIGK